MERSRPRPGPHPQLTRRMRATCSPIFRNASSIVFLSVASKKCSEAPGSSAVPAQLRNGALLRAWCAASLDVSDTV